MFPNLLQSFSVALLLCLFAGCKQLGRGESKTKLNPALLLFLSKPSQQDVVNNFADNIAYETYSLAYAKTQSLQTAVNAFVASPDSTKFEAVRTAYTEARRIYLQSEAFRFSNGPIDNSNEWNKGNPSSPATIEPIINAWPMDEQYIDTYMTNNSSPTAYTSSSLFNANGGSATCTPACTDSAKNISVGWHSVEFLLWGSDVSTTGPGPGSSSDFAATSGTCTTTQMKRSCYLKGTTDLLVSSLKELVDLWEPNKGSYNIKFKKDISGSLKNIFTGIAKFAKQEWGGERLKGVESGDQEDEHSCFSDLTKEDFIYDAQGVLNVFTGDFNGKTGAGLDEIISANSLKTNITSARDTFDSTKTGGISGRYDQVILSGDPERSKLTTVKTTIQKISDDTITAGKSLGITISAN